MPARSVIVLDKRESPWHSFLKECFEETSSNALSFDSPSQASAAFAQGGCAAAFVNPDLLSMNFAQKLKALRESSPFRLFCLGPSSRTLPFDDFFEGEPPAIGAFQRKLAQHLDFPRKLSVLIVDDEKDIGHMIQDFLLDRSQPSFSVDYTPDGKLALEWLETRKYDCIILDVKMPVMDGREVYRNIVERRIAAPVIVFFDAISGQEIPDLYKIGRPAIVDKGSSQSSMPEMLALIKKMVYFG